MGSGYVGLNMGSNDEGLVWVLVMWGLIWVLFMRA